MDKSEAASFNAGLVLDKLLEKIENTKNMCFYKPPPPPPMVFTIPPPSFLQRSASAGKYALAIGGIIGASYGAYKLHQLYLVRNQIGNIADKFENLCGGDPPSAVLEDELDANPPSDDTGSSSDDDDDSYAGSMPSVPPGFPKLERKRKKKKPSVPFFQPYSKDRDSIRGAYLPRLVANLRARNPSIAYTRANRMQIERMAYRMMSEHGMRAFDIQQNIKRVALAVFFVTEEDIEIQREEAVLTAAGRLNSGAC